VKISFTPQGFFFDLNLKWITSLSKGNQWPTNSESSERESILPSASIFNATPLDSNQSMVSLELNFGNTFLRKFFTFGEISLTSFGYSSRFVPPSAATRSTCTLLEKTAIFRKEITPPPTWIAQQNQPEAPPPIHRYLHKWWCALDLKVLINVLGDEPSIPRRHSL